jgi:hypothetical protein
LILGSTVGFALAFAASVVIPGTIGFFIIFAAAIVGSFIGQVVVRIVGRKSSMAVGAFTALGYLLGAIARPLAMIARDGESAGDVAGLIFGNPWSLIFACIAAVVSWGMLR